MKLVRNIIEYRELLLTLTISNIKARYKQTILGIGWAVLQPLIFMLVIVAVFSRLVRVPTGDIPYPLFVYAGLLGWLFFSNALSFAIPNLVQNVQLLRKIYFPREILIISAMLPFVVDFAIALLLFGGLLLYYNISPSMHLFLLPAIFFIQCVLILGVSFGGAILNVAFRDIAKSLPVILQIWMFASPIVYPLSAVPESVQNIYLLNPMAGIIDSYRKVFLEQTWPDFSVLMLAFVVSLLFFLGGYYMFKKGEQIIADII